MGRTIPKPDRRWVPAALVGLGVLLAVVTVAEVSFRSLQEGAITSSYAAAVASSLLFNAGLVGGGLVLRSDGVDESRYPHVAGGVLVGATFFVVFLGVVALSFVDTPLNQFSVLRWAVSLGGAAGFLIAFLNARTIDAAVTAERAVVRAEEAERRQDLLEYLNTLLRHEVLNTATVIHGNAAIVAEAMDDPDVVEERIDIIRRQTAELNEVIEDVRLLLETAEDSTDLEAMNLTRVVREELGKLDDRYGAVETETDVPDGLYVRADDLLGRLLGNLFQNAVEHNDRETPRVSVSASRSTDTVAVQVEDNGSGFPCDELDEFVESTRESNDNHGLGLAIVRRLADRYDGAVELTETGPDGSVLTVELPLARTGDDGRVTERASSPQRTEQ